MKTEIDEDVLRISTQFRSADAMVYDLRSKAGRLTLRVSGRGQLVRLEKLALAKLH